MSKSKQQETYSFGDYFSDPKGKGVEYVLDFEGRKLTFRIKRTLTLKERQAASNAAFDFKIDAEAGTVALNSMDQSAYNNEILLAGLISWPFTYPEDFEVDELAGEPVPINRETVEALDGRIAEAVASRILGLGEGQAKALDPFGKRSGAV